MVWGAVSGIALGVLATLGVQAGLRAVTARSPLEPLAVGAETVLLPPRARVVEAAAPRFTVSWAPPEARRTRCGARAGAELRETLDAIPPGASHCWRHDYFEGGSGGGECPSTTVCIARRGGTEMTCYSDDRVCEAVVAAFAEGARR